MEVKDTKVSKTTVDWMARKYAEFNRDYFDNKLPNDCVFATDMSTAHWGQASCSFNLRMGKIVAYNFKIKMTNAYLMTEEVKSNVLLHEMIHILDYSQYPHHFMSYDYRGKLHSVRYDAHGSTLFIPEAERLKQYGFNISKTVTMEEKATSEMDAGVARKLEKKRMNGYILGYEKFSKNVSYKDQGMMFKTTPSQIGQIISRCKEINDFYKSAPHVEYIEFYKTNSSKYLRYPGCRGAIKGWYMSEEKWTELVKNLDGDTELVKRETFMEPENPYTVPLFRMTLTNGKKIEVRNKTKEELKTILQEKFPKASESAIEKIMNTKSFYPMNEKKMTITEEDIMKMVTETVKQVISDDVTGPIQGDNPIFKKQRDGSISAVIA